MFAIWNKLFMDIEPAEIRNAIEVLKDLDKNDIDYCLNEALVRYGFQWDSLLKEYYIKRNDKFPDELCIKQLFEITIQQIKDYIRDMENMNDIEIQYIFNNLLNVLGLTQDVKFRDFFIAFMDRYNSSEELTRVDNNVYGEQRIIDDLLDDYNIEELKTIRDEIDAKIIELRNEENVN